VFDNLWRRIVTLGFSIIRTETTRKQTMEALKKIEKLLEQIEGSDYYGPEVRNYLREIRRLCLVAISESLKGQTTED